MVKQLSNIGKVLGLIPSVLDTHTLTHTYTHPHIHTHMEVHEGSLSESKARNEQNEHMINVIMRLFT